MTYMLDADICVFCLRKRSDVLNRIQSIGLGEITLSAITVCELEFGALKSGRSAGIQATSAFVQQFPILVINHEVAKEYAAVRLELESRGTPIGSNDTLLAAHARYMGLTLVTHNLREFMRVPNLDVETWI